MKKYTLHAFFALSFVSMIGAGNLSAREKECPRIDILQFDLLNKPGKEEFLKDAFPGWTMNMKKPLDSYHRKSLLDGTFAVGNPPSTKKTVCKYYVTRDDETRRGFSFIVAEFILTVKE